MEKGGFKYWEGGSLITSLYLEGVIMGRGWEGWM